MVIENKNYNQFSLLIKYLMILLLMKLAKIKYKSYHKEVIFTAFKIISREKWLDKIFKIIYHHCKTDKMTVLKTIIH
jgi:hypothetical protein